jgi:metal-responsive CopG/Arc/MetJ family transcriptional regulator
MYKQNDGIFIANISIPNEELVEEIESVVEANDELNTSRFFREAAKRELQRREQNE